MIYLFAVGVVVIFRFIPTCLMNISMTYRRGDAIRFVSTLFDGTIRLEIPQLASLRFVSKFVSTWFAEEVGKVIENRTYRAIYLKTRLLIYSLFILIDANPNDRLKSFTQSTNQ